MDSSKLPDMVKEMFGKIAQENGFGDYSLEVNPGCKPGDGYLSELFRITIYNEETNNKKKLDLVCKIAPSTENNGMDSFGATTFRNEALFYEKIMPIFTKFQNEKNVPNDDQYRSLPKCYATLIDDERQRYVIVLEDLRPHGFQMCDKSKLTPIENLRLTMRELGKFHGLSIAMKNQRPDEFAVVMQAKDMMKVLFETESIREMFAGVFDNTITSLRKEGHKIIMRNLKDNMLKYVETCLDEEKSDELAALCHGQYFNCFYTLFGKQTKI